MSRQQQQQRTTLFIDNIHCPSCVSGIQDILATYTLTKVHSVQDSSFPRTSIDDKADGLIARIRSTGAASSAAGSASAAALELGLGDSSDEPALTQIAVSIVDGTASFNQDPTFNLNPVIQELQAAGFTVSDHDWSDATSSSARNQHSNRHNHNGEGRGAFRSFSDLFGGGGSSNAATARRQRAHRAICKACQDEDKEAQIAASGCGGGCCGRNTLSPHSSSSSPDREKANALEKKVTNPAPAADAAAAPAPAPALVETTAIVVGLSCSSCVSSIETVLTPQRVPGLKSTRVLLLDNTVIVVHDPAIFSVEDLTTAINDQGFEVEDASSKPLSPPPGARGGKKKAVAQAAAAVATPAPSSAAATTGTKNASSFRPEKWSVLLSIEGMTCSSCTGTIENGLKDAQGISDVRVDLMSNSATLTVTSLGLAEDAAKHITKMGYPAQVMTVGSISTPGKKISSIQPADAKNHITTTPEKWAVLLSIEGMTCSSCTGTIENGLKGHSGVIDVKVDLMSNSATLVVTNREMAESAAEAVGELGYPAQVTSVELLSGGRAEKRQKATKVIPPGYKALFLIGGMTCSSCVNTISNGIRGIAGVSDFEVDLMAQSGSGNITDESLAQKIKEDIRDLGYEAEILKVEPLASAGDDVDGDEVEPKPRNVSIRIDGLFCEKCPPRVNKVLEEFSIKFDDLSYTPVTLDDPSATLTYIPRPPEFSLRIVKLAIQELGFTMNVLQAETLQDRAMRVQKKERQRLLIRLMIAIVFCIPTFIFGVVGPSFLSASNGFRRYLETPIAGGAARFKIALLVLSTPVQFGVGSLFYTHSYKSLRGVWRKRGGKISKRKVWLDRLFRWGSMDSLVALGTTIAWVSSLAYLALDIRGTGMSSEMGFFDTSVFLITFILAGRYLESLSKQRTGDALSELSKLRPQKGLLYGPDGTTEDIEAIFIERGDRVLVPVGSAAPLDGVLTEDSSLTAFDEASLTGESRPVGKKAGDTIYGATINAGPGAAVLKITNGDGETVIDSITLGVRNAMGKKASLERLADSITAIFVPVIVGIAVTTLLIWIVRGYSGNLPLEWLMDQERGGWLLFSIQFAVAVLVVACPCGIGLAAPTAQLVGVGIAARNGIMPNGGGEAFQTFSHIDAIIFDKTGTLTLGQFQVTATKTTDALDDARLWASLANIEQASSHPIALAVHAHANAKRESNPPASPLRMVDITEIPGKGMKATLSGGSGDKDAFEMAVGNVKLMEEVGARVSEEMSSQLLEWQNNGMSSVTVSYKSLGGTGPAVVAAAIAVVDPIRPETAYVLQDLERQGVAAYIVSGDAERTVQAVAKQLSIPVEQAIGGASPEDKKAFIEKLQGTMSDGGNQKNTGRFAGFLRSKKSKKQQTKRKLVAMVGDGVNDSIALAQADVSIALGGGSQVATSTAHFALLSDSLLSILLLQAISRSTYRRIISNFLWACVYNVVLIPIAAGAFYDLGRTKLPAVWASLAMALSSLSVVFNSLLLRYTFRVPKAVQRYRNSAA